MSDRGPRDYEKAIKLLSVRYGDPRDLAGGTFAPNN